ncbi:MAG: putative oxidoreductase [Glaciecola sp.]|jgi:putative oxidoreductase|uniref:DoxX family protein n=1 Tax=Congregibacter sp. TaxID=2744308 RepID=UPI0039E4E180
MLLVGRTLLGLYFIVPGITKITGFEGMVQYMSAHGVPFVQPLLIFTIILQLACGASLVAGRRTQLMAFVLAGLTLVISLYMHDFWSMEEGLQRAHEMQNFIKNMAIMAGLLYVAGVTPARKA